MRSIAARLTCFTSILWLIHADAQAISSAPSPASPTLTTATSTASPQQQAATASSSPLPQNVNSVCYTYGVDFQNGGIYFLNGTTSNFSCVSTFSGCNNDYASILLVNNQNSNQWECSSVPTVPDSSPELSTCPITKNQMQTGNWTIIALGNNGNGNPFAWQRSFSLNIAPQSTVTTTPTISYTVTSTPLVTPTTNPGNPYDATIHVITSTLTFTLSYWTATQVASTIIAFPSCTVPAVQQTPDPVAWIRPTVVPMPSSLRLPSKPKFNMAGGAQQPLTSRQADQPTITVNAKTAAKRAVTVTAPPFTQHKFLAGATAGNGQISTNGAWDWPFTITSYTYTTTDVTSTASLTYLYTTTATPAGLERACKAQGGHFGGATSSSAPGAKPELRKPRKKHEKHRKQKEDKKNRKGKGGWGGW